METLVHILCSRLPTRILAYAPFPHAFRFGKWAVVLSVLFSQGLELLFAWLVIRAGHPEWVRLVEFLFAPVSTALFLLNVRESPPKLIFFYLFVVDYLMIVVGISSFISVRVFDSASRTWESSAVCLLVYAFTWVPIYRLFRSCVLRVDRTNAPGLWRIIWVVPALTTAIVILFTGSLDDALVGKWSFLFTRVGLLACVLVIYGVIVQSLNLLQKQAELEKRLAVETHLLDVQIAEQKKHGQLLMENAELIRRQRHDLRHQLTYLQELANGDSIKLREYLASLIESIPAPAELFCENEAVNAVVSHYAATCRRQGASFTARLSVPACGAPDSDLCVVFANLLENAAEACARMKQGERFVTLHSSWQDGLLTITMENSFEGPIREENGQFYSSKRDDFGVGLSSVQAMASKYGGRARFSHTDSIFSSSVFLYL